MRKDICKILCSHKFLFALIAILIQLQVSAQITVGLINQSEETFDGYTLIAPMRSRNIYLIDNCGEIVHRWQSQYQNATVAYMLEDGSLIRSYAVPGSFSGGGITGGIEHIDWESNVIWDYEYTSNDYHHHHDFEVLPNGNILILAWERKGAFQATQAGRVGNIPSSGIWPEQIVEVVPADNNSVEIIWEWHLWDHLIQDVDPSLPNYGDISENPQRFNINFGPAQSDWIHANSIDYNPARDEIIISSRNFDEFWIIDHSTTTEEATGTEGGNSGKGGDILYRWGNPSTYGLGSLGQQFLSGQHDAHWIEEGKPFENHIMVFNNRQGNNQSSVLIIDPPLDGDGNYIMEAENVTGPEEPTLLIDGGDNNGFDADRISGAQMLNNGNILVCEGTEGRLLELDSDNHNNWEYINPQGSGIFEQGQQASGNTLFRAYRYSRYHPAFENRDLSPQGPIELNPIDTDCMLYTSTLNQAFDKTLVYYDGQNIIIEQDRGSEMFVELLNGQAQLLIKDEIKAEEDRLEMESLNSGIYFVRLSNKAGQYSLKKLFIY